MVTAELIGRHFVISSWWLTAGLSFSNSLISLLWKYTMSGVYLKYAVVTRIKLFTALLITGWVTWQKQEWKGRFMQDPMCSKLTHWWRGISQLFWIMKRCCISMLNFENWWPPECLYFSAMWAKLRTPSSMTYKSNLSTSKVCIFYHLLKCEWLDNILFPRDDILKRFCI